MTLSPPYAEKVTIVLAKSTYFWGKRLLVSQFSFETPHALLPSRLLCPRDSPSASKKLMEWVAGPSSSGSLANSDKFHLLRLLHQQVGFYHYYHLGSLTILYERNNIFYNKYITLVIAMIKYPNRGAIKSKVNVIILMYKQLHHSYMWHSDRHLKMASDGSHPLMFMFPSNLSCFEYHNQ